jgi:hypothetical protein
MYTQGLKNLKNLKSKFLNQKSKTESQTNQLVNQFTSNNHAKDALYNKGANLISQFPNSNGDFKFLLIPLGGILGMNNAMVNPMMNPIMMGGILGGVIGGFLANNISLNNNMDLLSNFNNLSIGIISINSFSFQNNAIAV